MHVASLALLADAPPCVAHSRRVQSEELRREKTIVDKRPIWWVLGLLVLALGPLFTPLDLQNTLLTAGATFGIYAAISLCWMLIIGTAGIMSLATYAVVGTAAFCTAFLSIKFGLPWWLLPPIGAVVGSIFGGIHRTSGNAP